MARLGGLVPPVVVATVAECHGCLGGIELVEAVDGRSFLEVKLEETARLAAAVGAIIIGLIESFGAFYSSAYKEAIVFALLIPALVWLSLRAVPDEEQEDL